MDASRGDRGSEQGEVTKEPAYLSPRKWLKAEGHEGPKVRRVGLMDAVYRKTAGLEEVSKGRQLHFRCGGQNHNPGVCWKRPTFPKDPYAGRYTRRV
jgi:hypothetical protein